MFRVNGMSRFLTRKKHLIILFLACCSVIGLLLAKHWLVAILFTILITSVYWFNRLIKKSIYSQVPNMYVYKERNIDYMIIGEPCNELNIVPNIQNKTGLVLTSPTRTLFSSILIFKRMFSYLGKGGTVYFVGGSRYYNSNKVAYTEIPFLHGTTINSKNLNSKVKMLKAPLLFYPISSICFLLSKNSTKNRAYTNKTCDADIIEFCKERDINVFYKEIN